jgi:hypothetical protein
LKNRRERGKLEEKREVQCSEIREYVEIEGELKE